MLTCRTEIATTIHEIDADKDALLSDPERLGVLFREMIQMCLWGNATVCYIPP